MSFRHFVIDTLVSLPIMRLRLTIMTALAASDLVIHILERCELWLALLRECGQTEKEIYYGWFRLRNGRGFGAYVAASKIVLAKVSCRVALWRDGSLYSNTGWYHPNWGMREWYYEILPRLLTGKSGSFYIRGNIQESNQGLLGANHQVGWAIDSRGGSWVGAGVHRGASLSESGRPIVTRNDAKRTHDLHEQIWLCFVRWLELEWSCWHEVCLDSHCELMQTQRDTMTVVLLVTYDRSLDWSSLSCSVSINSYRLGTCLYLPSSVTTDTFYQGTLHCIFEMV